MLRDQLVDALREALVALDVQPLPDVINLERPARREHGDWSTNVALASAKKAGRNPRELAQAIADGDEEAALARARDLLERSVR